MTTDRVHLTRNVADPERNRGFIDSDRMAPLTIIYRAMILGAAFCALAMIFGGSAVWFLMRLTACR